MMAGTPRARYPNVDIIFKACKAQQRRVAEFSEENSNSMPSLAALRVVE